LTEVSVTTIIVFHLTTSPTTRGSIRHQSAGVVFTSRDLRESHAFWNVCLACAIVSPTTSGSIRHQPAGVAATS
jgi:hypothetical protein